MRNFVGIPPFSNPLWVAMETMLFHIANTKTLLRPSSFRTQGVPRNNFAPMKKCPGVQGNLNRIPGYVVCIFIHIVAKMDYALTPYFILAAAWTVMEHRECLVEQRLSYKAGLGKGEGSDKGGYNK